MGFRQAGSGIKGWTAGERHFVRVRTEDEAKIRLKTAATTSFAGGRMKDPDMFRY